MPIHTTAVRNSIADLVVDLLDVGVVGNANGQLIFRTAGDVEVATLNFANPAFGAAAVGVATANAITSDTNATGGTTTKATLEDRANTEILEATVGTSGTDIILSSTAIGATDTVSMSSLTYAAPT